MALDWYNQLDPASRQQLMMLLGGRLLQAAPHMSNENPYANLGNAIVGGLGDLASIRQAAMQNEIAKQNLEMLKERRAEQERERENREQQSALVADYFGGGLGSVTQPLQGATPPGAIGMPPIPPAQRGQVPGDAYMPAAQYVPPQQNVDMNKFRSALGALNLQQGNVAEGLALQRPLTTAVPGTEDPTKQRLRILANKMATGTATEADKQEFILLKSTGADARMATMMGGLAGNMAAEDKVEPDNEPGVFEQGWNSLKEWLGFGQPSAAAGGMPDTAAETVTFQGQEYKVIPKGDKKYIFVNGQWYLVE